MSADLPRGLVRSRRTRVLALALTFAVLLLVALASIAIGARAISPGTVLDAFTHYDRTLDEHLIVRTLRVPRTLVGLLVGLALGMAGTLFQGVTRNPLADPGILGVNAGASLAVVMAIYLLGVGSLLGYVWFGFLGAAVASVAVYLLGALGRGGATPIKLALAGSAVAAFLSALSSAILVIDAATLNQYRFWAVGSVAGRDGTIAAQVAPFVVVGAVLALVTGRMLNTLALGDDVAQGLGQRVGLIRVYSGLVAVLLVGAAVAAAGPISFLGLVVPHLARMIAGTDYRWILAFAALIGPILLLGCDVLGRIAARPGEIQVGIVVAVIGGPFFIALVRRRRLVEL
ncbi:iron ABC transporter permease [Nocardioides marmoriginsengisoli]|uniref:Iron ABC transporter permease n=1 Tax=Nocardioides marmoriginsengisoli TaxID=661483 RepID=A0A3N0CL72_9ACTN|nr:iron ABC transporter permease [Nocardioides marmoriginsengisoli]RNL63766.1 iron ABC transporter permease [Nocardioides marmoriginsengisoli]